MPRDSKSVRNRRIAEHAKAPSPAGTRLIAATVACTLLGGWINTALAVPPVLSVPSDEDFQAGQNGTQQSGLAGYLARLNRSELLLGDMGGLRTELSKYGIS